VPTLRPQDAGRPPLPIWGGQYLVDVAHLKLRLRRQFFAWHALDPIGENVVLD
jgi:hypothetical protein